MPSSTVCLKFFKLKRIANPLVSAGAAALLVAAGLVSIQPAQPAVALEPLASVTLNTLLVKGRAPKTGYDREKFSDGWGQLGSCDLRNYILKRDLTREVMKPGYTCVVASGQLKDPYTAKTINFVRGVATSSAVQIDHVVAVSDAWQKGAQRLSASKRFAFYNDPLNLMAVDGPTNARKGDSDAASWLPPNKSYRCAYVARQIAVKKKYSLWVTAAEKSQMRTVLTTCPSQRLPT